MAGSLPDPSGAPVFVGELKMEEEWIDDAGQCGNEFAACVAKGYGGGMCLMIECRVGGGEEPVGSGMVIFARDGIEPEGWAVGDAVDRGDDDGGVPAGAGFVACFDLRFGLRFGLLGWIVVGFKCRGWRQGTEF